MVPNMQNQGSNFGTGSKFRTSEPVPETGSAISEQNPYVYFLPKSPNFQITDIPKPWNVSFSFGRALQASALKAWNGKDSQVSDWERHFSS